MMQKYRHCHYMVVLLVLFVAACTALPEDRRSDARDPYEIQNRKVFAFNLKVDDVVLEPAAKAYRRLPETGQRMLTNYAEWTSLPSTSINSALQGDIENTSIAVLTFLVNGLTLGLADLTDDAKDPRATRFDDTMAKWNLPEGNYYVLPITGGGTARRHVGFFVDAVINPLNFMTTPAASTIVTAEKPVAVVTYRGNNLELLNSVKYDSVDPYARSRSVYYQHTSGRHGDPEDKEDAFDAFISSNP